MPMAIIACVCAPDCAPIAMALAPWTISPACSPMAIAYAPIWLYPAFLPIAIEKLSTTVSKLASLPIDTVSRSNLRFGLNIGNLNL